MLEGWSTDYCKKFFGQMITSNAKALQLRVGLNLDPSLV